MTIERGCVSDSLPPAQPRQLAHTREVTFHGYRRDDGLWDIEAHMRDTKPVPFTIPSERTWAANEPIHDMSIRLTVDTQLVIRDIAVAMSKVPHAGCPEAAIPMHKMIGCTLGAGWRRAIEENLGNDKGCTHLRELLFNMATACGLLGFLTHVSPRSLRICSSPFATLLSVTSLCTAPPLVHP
jgi:hypothetical protein